ncbi:hypothetical protein [Enterococcus italicus]|uniref:hypothetical protein n=1 Tax=Enterococcus italicus TaxID=246144 RepID=UPI002073C7D1|nr:hypothetical protein [Enterococcus italicus]
MKDGSESGDFWYAYHAYHNNGLLPSIFSEMSVRERGIIMAFIDLKVEAEEKEAKKMKRKK